MRNEFLQSHEKNPWWYPLLYSVDLNRQTQVSQAMKHLIPLYKALSWFFLKCSTKAIQQMLQVSDMRVFHFINNNRCSEHLKLCQHSLCAAIVRQTNVIEPASLGKCHGTVNLFCDWSGAYCCLYQAWHSCLAGGCGPSRPKTQNTRTVSSHLQLVSSIRPRTSTDTDSYPPHIDIMLH